MGYIRLEEVQAVSAFPGVAQRTAVGRALGATGIQLAELVLAPGAEIPLHHHDVDDAMLVISGRGRCALGGEEFLLEPGVALVAPAGTSHGLRNDGTEPLRIVVAWPTVEPVVRYLDA
ncbi:MAG: cupin domain-containing protein [Armatimonadota bacterium]|nr:cupin domain-containing protein [Armatimonadota bacterium]MDR7450327.1 cupin domain-containing protein [Armatimonadota bacterium]MDR7467090.1 cupin domain-containing protein [Armatimonadota bacterium]MDR7493368.1 cupin domain-containing protein [Armatimonadota bacterium]MDR7499376.1 cupin domain-containing protein [Armatimonadota bacterium]